MSPYIAMLIPAIVASLGGFLAVFWSPSHQTRSLILNMGQALNVNHSISYNFFNNMVVT